MNLFLKKKKAIFKNKHYQKQNKNKINKINLISIKLRKTQEKSFYQTKIKKIMSS